MNVSDETKKKEEGGRVGEERSHPLPVAPALIFDPARFASSLSDQVFSSSVPDALTKQCLRSAGAYTDEQALVRLVSMASQVFLTDVLRECVEFSKRRENLGGRANTSSTRASTASNTSSNHLLLTVQDLSQALATRGINLGHPPYFMKDKSHCGRRS